MIEIRQPNDFHNHFRDGEALKTTVAPVARTFGRAVAMPNLQPPIRNLEEAIQYKKRIMKYVPLGSYFEPIMTIYLTDSTTEDDIIKAKSSGIIYASKLYPAGATTNSEFGVTAIERIDNVLNTMATVGMLLLVHGEVTHPEVDVFDREKVFIETVLKPIIDRHSTLKIVFEHITTSEAVEFVRTSTSGNLAATITAHHLLYSRNALFTGGLRPHMYCLPVLKRETHRMALLNAATSGDPRFFLGTDSAPHSIVAKEGQCSCAGIFTSHAAIELYAEAFDSIGRIDALEGFASLFGARFYGIPISDKTIKLVREDWTVPETYCFASEEVRPLRAGEIIKWKKL